VISIDTLTAWVDRHFLPEQRAVILSEEPFSVVLKHERGIGASDTIAGAALYWSLQGRPQIIVDRNFVEAMRRVHGHLVDLGWRAHLTGSGSIQPFDGARILFQRPDEMERARGFHADVWLEAGAIDSEAFEMARQAERFWSRRDNRIRVVVDKPPFPVLHLTGAGLVKRGGGA
jgi:hypothetical protein